MSLCLPHKQKRRGGDGGGEAKLAASSWSWMAPMQMVRRILLFLRLANAFFCCCLKRVSCFGHSLATTTSCRELLW